MGGAIADGTEIWDTDELVVGSHNGKPIYQKTFEITTPTTLNAWVECVYVGNLHIDKILEIAGAVVGEGDFQFALPVYSSATITYATVIYENKYLKIRLSYTAHTNKKGTLRILYTKTTDIE